MAKAKQFVTKLRFKSSIILGVDRYSPDCKNSHIFARIFGRFYMDSDQLNMIKELGFQIELKKVKNPKGRDK